MNKEDVFEREIKLCEDFRYFESTDDVIISFNVSSREVIIWVYYNKNWNAARWTEILNTLLKRRKLDLVGYLPRQMKIYPAMEWQERKITCQYTFQRSKFNFDMYFYEVRTYDDSYDFYFQEMIVFAFFRLRWMLLSSLNTHTSVSGAIVHATKNLNFLLNFLTQ